MVRYTTAEIRRLIELIESGQASRVECYMESHPGLLREFRIYHSPEIIAISSGDVTTFDLVCEAKGKGLLHLIQYVDLEHVELLAHVLKKIDGRLGLRKILEYNDDISHHQLRLTYQNWPGCRHPGRRDLETAIRMDNVGAVRFLLGLMDNLKIPHIINKLNRHGASLFHMAIDICCPDMISLLYYRCGAQLEKPRRDGLTVYDLAIYGLNNFTLILLMRLGYYDVSSRTPNLRNYIRFRDAASPLVRTIMALDPSLGVAPIQEEEVLQTRYDIYFSFGLLEKLLPYVAT